MPCARPTVGQLSFTVWLDGKFHLPIESRAPQPVNRWLADPAEHLWLWRLGCGAVPTIDLCQTLLILSKVIFWVKVWAMKKGALAILVTPVDKVGHVVSLMGGLEKVDGTDARWVVVRCW